MSTARTKNECFRIGLVASILQQHGVEDVNKASYVAAQIVATYVPPVNDGVKVSIVNRILRCMDADFTMDDALPEEHIAYRAFIDLGWRIASMLVCFDGFKIGQIKGD